MTDGPGTSSRRIPQQPRSRRKVAILLDTALRLFRESGMDQVSMREIARASEMPIATVYQYFPNKQAIVKTIWENYTSAIGGLVETELQAIRDSPSVQSVRQIIDRLVDSIADYHDQNPSFLEIRWCVDASPELRQLNLNDTLNVAGLIQDAILTVNPAADKATLTSYTIIATEAASSTIRLGQQMDQQQRTQLLSTLKSFLLKFYSSLATPDSTQYSQ